MTILAAETGSAARGLRWQRNVNIVLVVLYAAVLCIVLLGMRGVASTAWDADRHRSYEAEVDKLHARLASCEEDWVETCNQVAKLVEPTDAGGALGMRLKDSHERARGESRTKPEDQTAREGRAPRPESHDTVGGVDGRAPKPKGEGADDGQDEDESDYTVPDAIHSPVADEWRAGRLKQVHKVRPRDTRVAALVVQGIAVAVLVALLGVRIGQDDHALRTLMVLRDSLQESPPPGIAVLSARSRELLDAGLGAELPAALQSYGPPKNYKEATEMIGFLRSASELGDVVGQPAPPDMSTQLASLLAEAEIAVSWARPIVAGGLMVVSIFVALFTFQPAVDDATYVLISLFGMTASVSAYVVLARRSPDAKEALSEIRELAGTLSALKKNGAATAGA